MPTDLTADTAMPGNEPFVAGWAIYGMRPRWTRVEIDATCADVDAGVRAYVRVLMDNGFETFQSCEGADYDAMSKTWTGVGHCYAEPTVEFHGTAAEGMRALAICRERGLPVRELRRVWSVLEGEPTGPHWALTFDRKANA